MRHRKKYIFIEAKQPDEKNCCIDHHTSHTGNECSKAFSARDTAEYYIDSIHIASLNFLDHSKIENTRFVKADGKKNLHNKVFVSIKKTTQLQ